MCGCCFCCVDFCFGGSFFLLLWFFWLPLRWLWFEVEMMRMGFFVLVLSLAAGLALSGCLQSGAPSKQAAPVLTAANVSSAAAVLPAPSAVVASPSATVSAASSASPSAKPPEKCTLMRNAEGVAGCFGCSSGICSNAPDGFSEYVLPSDYVGIPYACFATEKGCELAQ